MNRCRRWAGFVLLALLFGNGCSPETTAPGSAAETQPEKVVQVQVETLQRQDISDDFTLPGSLEPWEDLLLAAEIAGPVRWSGPVEGERLKAGADILRIDTETLAIDAERHRSILALRAKKLERYLALHEEQLVSSQELDELRLAVAETQADLSQAEELLKKGTLRTPIAGVLDDLLVDAGEYVNIGEPLARIVQVERLKVLVDVPEKDVPFLRAGQQVEIIPAVVNDRRAVYKLTGKIEFVSLTADERTRTYRVKIAIDNTNGLLRPGMIVRARFVRQQLQQVLMVPLYAVLDRDGDSLVFVDDGGIARQRQVEAGNSVGSRVVILRGLEEGERLIIRGQQLLVDGARIDAGGN